MNNCKRGHELISDNTYTRPSGKNACRICRNDRERERYNETVRAGFVEKLPAEFTNCHSCKGTREIYDRYIVVASATGMDGRAKRAIARACRACG